MKIIEKSTGKIIELPYYERDLFGFHQNPRHYRIIYKGNRIIKQYESQVGYQHWSYEIDITDKFKIL